METTDLNRSHHRILSRRYYRISLVSYTLVSLVYVIGFTIGALIYRWVWSIGALIMLYNVLRWAYNMAELRSMKLYADADGVWYYRGLMPWNRGVRGMRWRDLDIAGYQPGLISWLTSSYGVTFAHRFNPDGDMRLGHIAHGDQAAMEFNEIHQALINGYQDQQPHQQAVIDVPYVEVLPS